MYLSASAVTVSTKGRYNKWSTYNGIGLYLFKIWQCAQKVYWPIYLPTTKGKPSFPTRIIVCLVRCHRMLPRKLSWLRHCTAYLSVVGKISGVYKKTIPKEPVMPNFPIILKVILSGINDVPSPVSYNSWYCIHCDALSPIHTADADTTQLDGWVASAVCTRYVAWLFVRTYVRLFVSVHACLPNIHNTES